MGRGIRRVKYGPTGQNTVLEEQSQGSRWKLYPRKSCEANLLYQPQLKPYHLVGKRPLFLDN